MVLIRVFWDAGEYSHVVMDTGKNPACASYQAYNDMFVQARGQLTQLDYLAVYAVGLCGSDFPGVPLSW